MFSHLYHFMQAIRARVMSNDRLTLIQHRDAEFSQMSRSQLLKLRESCFDVANMVTEYICWQDSRDDRDIDADEKEHSPF